MFSVVQKLRLITFYGMWKWYEIPLPVSINKVVLRHTTLAVNRLSTIQGDLHRS